MPGSPVEGKETWISRRSLLPRPSFAGRAASSPGLDEADRTRGPDHPRRGRTPFRTGASLSARAGVCPDHMATRRSNTHAGQSTTAKEIDMAATLESPTAPERGRPLGNDQAVADVLVVFGITGDLARVMTFRSLYRLERQGMLDCPIVGVAVDDWTKDQLVERARESILGTGEDIDNAVFERFAARLSYVHGDFKDPATYQRVGDAIKGTRRPVFYLEIPPFLFGTVVGNLA